MKTSDKPLKQQRFVSYLRVSTERQGRSGLGLEAQRAAVHAHIARVDGKLLEEFVEVETGKDDARPQLAQALKRARLTQAVLIIAKLDRLSRNIAFIDQLQDGKVKFICADMPEANDTMVSFMAVMAKHERKAISERTRVALQAAKARGKRLGNPNGAAAIRAAGKGNLAAVAAIKAIAARHRVDLLPIIDDIRATGITSFGGIAAALNEREISSARGGIWHPMQVKRVIEGARK